jgi:hypothetical protein
MGGVLTLVEKYQFGMNPIFCEDYPFDESFDEVYVKVAKWMFGIAGIKAKQ